MVFRHAIEFIWDRVSVQNRQSFSKLAIANVNVRRPVRPCKEQTLAKCGPQNLYKVLVKINANFIAMGFVVDFFFTSSFSSWLWFALAVPSLIFSHFTI